MNCQALFSLKNTHTKKNKKTIMIIKMPVVISTLRFSKKGVERMANVDTGQTEPDLYVHCLFKHFSIST